MPLTEANTQTPNVCPEHGWLTTEVKLINQELTSNTEITKEILDTLKGNGQEGLTTRAALNKDAIKRAWWWLGGISMTLLGLVAWVLRGHL